MVVVQHVKFMCFNADRIFKTLEEIKSEQRKNFKRLLRESKKQHSATSAELISVFPLKTQQDLDDLERKLLEESFESTVVSACICAVNVMWIVVSSFIVILFSIVSHNVTELASAEKKFINFESIVWPVMKPVLLIKLLIMFNKHTQHYLDFFL